MDAPRPHPPVPSKAEVEDGLRAFAKVLAPFVAAELGDRGKGMPLPAGDPGDYSDAGCRRFVEGLGPTVIERALILFGALAEEGRIDSVELAARIGTAPRGSRGC